MGGWAQSRLQTRTTHRPGCRGRLIAAARFASNPLPPPRPPAGAPRPPPPDALDGTKSQDTTHGKMTVLTVDLGCTRPVRAASGAGGQHLGVSHRQTPATVRHRPQPRHRCAWIYFIRETSSTICKSVRFIPSVVGRTRGTVCHVARCHAGCCPPARVPVHAAVSVLVLPHLPAVLASADAPVAQRWRGGAGTFPHLPLPASPLPRPPPPPPVASACPPLPPRRAMKRRRG